MVKNGDNTMSFGGANKYCCKIFTGGVVPHVGGGGWDVRGVEMSQSLFLVYIK